MSDLDGGFLVQSILEGTGNIVSYAQELLRAIGSGYPIQSIEGILASPDPRISARGVWIASEMWDRSAPILSGLVRHLGHPWAHIRALAVPTVLVCSPESSPEIIVNALRLIYDQDRSVRWTVVECLARLSEPKMDSIAKWLGGSVWEQDSALRWITSADSADCSHIEEMLSAAESAHRLVALAAILRTGERCSRLLEHAEASADLELASFAQSFMRIRSGFGRPPAGGD